MKKNILSLIAFTSLTLSSVFAQDGIEIRLDGAGPDISGTVHSINLYASSPDLVGGLYQVHFDVTNNTGSDQQWQVTRKKMSVPASWSDQVCWPPQCYITNGDVYTTPNSGGNPAPTILNGTSTYKATEFIVFVSSIETATKLTPVSSCQSVYNS